MTTMCSTMKPQRQGPDVPLFLAREAALPLWGTFLTLRHRQDAASIKCCPECPLSCAGIWDPGRYEGSWTLSTLEGSVHQHQASALPIAVAKFPSGNWELSAPRQCLPQAGRSPDDTGPGSVWGTAHSLLCANGAEALPCCTRKFWGARDTGKGELHLGELSV